MLTLYVTGATARSLRAIANVKAICEQYLKGRYQLEVVDVYRRPALLRADQIVAVPTLIKKLPVPVAPPGRRPLEDGAGASGPGPRRAHLLEAPCPPRQQRRPLAEENERLRARLEELEETLRAIRSGEVDALVVETAGEDQVFTLKSADQTYRLMVEEMQKGAATLSDDGVVLYCNPFLAALLDVPVEAAAGRAALGLPGRAGGGLPERAAAGRRERGQPGRGLVPEGRGLGPHPGLPHPAAPRGCARLLHDRHGPDGAQAPGGGAGAARTRTGGARGGGGGEQGRPGGDRAAQAGRGVAAPGREAADRAPGARANRADRGGGGQPAEGRVPGHPVARAALAAQRHRGLVAHPARAGPGSRHRPPRRRRPSIATPGPRPSSSPTSWTCRGSSPASST